MTEHCFSLFFPLLWKQSVLNVFEKLIMIILFEMFAGKSSLNNWFKKTV